MIRVVLIDDQALVRAGFRMLLAAEDDIEVVGEAADGSAGTDLVQHERPDVALVDIRMPVLDGVECTRRICAEPGGRTRVLILTTFDDDSSVIEAVRAGASGFLLKSADPDELVDAVRAVAGGDAVVSPLALKSLLDHMSRAPQVRATGPVRSTPPSADPRLHGLTFREMEVLRLVGQGKSNAEIGGELAMAEATAKTHVSRILTKLGLRDRVQAVVLSYETRLVGPSAEE
ncbi:MAG: hypothetical protein RLZ55_1541 [Actinomycetota bacterium]